MDKETKDFWNSILKLLAVCVFAVLYSLGGWGYLWCRRYLAPVEFAGAMLWFSRGDWRSALSLAGIGALCLGYSATGVWESILRRGLFGLANGAAFSLPNLFNARFLISIFQIGLAPLTCIVLGVWNPLPNARTEELVIGFVIAFIPMMSCKPKV